MTTRKLAWYFCLPAMCLLASNSSSFADITTDISVPNFSFEEYHTAGNAYANQTPPNNPGPTGILFDNWVTTSANFQIFQNPVSNLTSTANTDGTFYFDASIPFGTVVTAETENPVTTIANNATYTLTVAVGVQTGKSPTAITLELLSGSNVLASAPVTQAAQTLAAGTLNNYSASFSTLLGNDSSYLGQNLSIAIIGSPTGGGQDFEMDNVRLTEVTLPEPSTWAMMFLGAGGLLVLSRRFRHSLQG